jgi:hypothetical protein
VLVEAPIRKNVPWEEVAADFLRDKKGEGRAGGTLAGHEARTRDPYVGKVALSFCIREGSKVASKRVLM